MIKIYIFFIFPLLQLTVNAQVYNAELIEYQTNTSINKGKLTSKISYVIKINNRAGEKYTKISIPYSKLSKVSQLKAYISNEEGKIIKKLSQSDITEKSTAKNFSFYEDNYVKEFTLKHNIYPYYVNYSYTRKESDFLYIDYWIPVINSSIPTRNALLTLTVPANYNISHSENLVPVPEVFNSKNNVTYRWKAKYEEIIEKEIKSPSPNKLLPSVKIVPLNFIYGIPGSFDSWQSFGNWQYKISEGLDILPEFEKINIRKIIEGLEDKVEKIRKLYHYLQDETRYINVTLETGGLKPYPASYVAKNKYGDCKALTNYFKSVLLFAGIESYYTKIYAGNPIIEIDTSFPSQQSNHIILYIPLDNDTLWLDCTSDNAFAYLGTFTQNRMAFVIDKDNGSHFINTPALTEGEVMEKRSIKCTGSRSGTRAHFNNTYRGEMYEILAGLKRKLTGDEQNRALKEYFIQEGFEMQDFTLSSPDRDSARISLKYNAESKNIYKYYGNDLLLENIPFEIPPFEEPKERDLPVQIDFLIYRVDTLVYEIPVLYKVSGELNEISIENNYGKYSISYNLSDNAICVIKTMLINSGYYPTTMYNDFYDFINMIKESEYKTHIVLTKK
ncbi:MAG: DUF3857 domain-containing protein [Bacteroidota bacterium]